MTGPNEDHDDPADKDHGEAEAGGPDPDRDGGDPNPGVDELGPTTDREQDSLFGEDSVTSNTPGDGDHRDGPFGTGFEEEELDHHSVDEQPAAPSTEGPTSPQGSEGGSSSGEGPISERSGPMSELADEVDKRRETTDEASGLFDQAGVSTVDPDVVWEQIESDDPIDASVETPEEREERVVDTGTFCERCEYFSSPPEVHCTHDGTEIGELVEVGKFRVFDCPKVDEEEQLEDL